MDDAIESPVFDRQDLLRRFMGDTDIARMLLDSFPAETEALMTGLEAAAQDRDAETARRLAHKLAGASGNLSGIALMRSARALENAAQTQDIETLPPLAAEIRGQYDLFVQRISEVILD